jgi:hypothetical protein
MSASLYKQKGRGFPAPYLIKKRGYMSVDKGIPIQMDTERHYRLTLRGAKLFAEKTGKDLLKGFRFEDLTTDDWIALIWAGLIHEDASLTFDMVSDMVDVSTFQDVCAVIVKSIAGKKKEKAESPLAQTSDKPTG